MSGFFLTKNTYSCHVFKILEEIKGTGLREKVDQARFPWFILFLLEKI